MAFEIVCLGRAHWEVLVRFGARPIPFDKHSTCFKLRVDGQDRTRSYLGADSRLHKLRCCAGFSFLPCEGIPLPDTGRRAKAALGVVLHIQVPQDVHPQRKI